MALDFPASPVIGQVFTGPNNAVWVWDGTKWLQGASVPVATTNPAYNNVGRNLIHNSMMNVNQRGASQPYSASGAYTLDRWQLGFTGGACATAQYGLDDALRAPIGDEAANLYMSNAFTGGGAAGDSTSITQSIEDVRRLAGKTVTLSCWAIASTPGMQLGLGLRISYGTGGSPSPAFYVPAVPVTLTGAFARYSATLVVPSAAGKTFGTNRDDRSVVVLVVVQRREPKCQRWRHWRTERRYQFLGRATRNWFHCDTVGET